MRAGNRRLKKKKLVWENKYTNTETFFEQLQDENSQLSVYCTSSFSRTY